MCNVIGLFIQTDRSEFAMRNAYHPRGNSILAFHKGALRPLFVLNHDDGPAQ